MIRRPPRSTRTDTLFPYTTLVRSVMRSVYVRPGEDADLRQLAHDFNVTKRDLIRSAIRLKLKEWLADNSGQKLLADVSACLRETNLQRQVGQVKPTKIAAAKTAAPAAKDTGRENVCTHGTNETTGTGIRRRT